MKVKHGLPKELPAALCGDRHQILPLPDGRLLVQFRDAPPTRKKGQAASPTEGDWVAWIGRWEDLKNGTKGSYKIRFKDNRNGWDCAYPAAELLPDHTLVCTIYGHFDKGIAIHPLRQIQNQRYGQDGQTICGEQSPQDQK